MKDQSHCGSLALIMAMAGAASGQCAWDLADVAQPVSCGTELYRVGPNDPEIVRRGCGPLVLAFRTVDPAAEPIIGVELRNTTSGTAATVLSSGGADVNGWKLLPGALIQRTDASGSVVLLREYHLTIPVGAEIGRYSLTALTPPPQGEQEAGRCERERDVIVLFNPYHQADETSIHQAGPGAASEFLENENGAVWVGSADNNGPRPWAYDQFDASVLAAALDGLAATASNSATDFKSPASVARALTKAIGAPETGMLLGRWDGQYGDGKNPGYWTSTSEIIAARRATGRPVRYGQCWVFASVTTSLSRSLGIPARVVTNLNSAHEHAPFDQKCDEYWIAGQGTVTRRFGADPRGEKVWNFHAWTEAFLRRPDIGAGVGDGWQAFDATPQESSETAYQCGPASLRSIQQGRNQDLWDTGFIRSETNASVNRIVRQESGDIVGTTLVAGAQRILTCSADIDDPQPMDLTATYRTSPGESTPLREIRGGFGLDFTPFLQGSLPLHSFFANGQLRFNLHTAPGWTSPTTIVVGAFSDDGTWLGDVKTFSIPAPLQGAQITQVSLSSGELLPFLPAATSLRFAAGSMDPAGRPATAQISVNLSPPMLPVAASAQKRPIGSAVSCTVRFTNPMPFALRGVNLRLRFSVNGHEASQRVDLLPSGAVMSVQLDESLASPARGLMIATLTCDQFASYGSTPVEFVACYADFNQDGGIDGADVNSFFEAWEGGIDAADTNADGGVDGSDVDAFFAAWEAGGCS